MAVSSGKVAGILPDFATGSLASEKGSRKYVMEPLPGLDRVMVVACSAAAVKLRPWLNEATRQVGGLMK